MADRPRAQGVQRSLLGTGWGFPPTFSAGTGTVGMTSDDDDIRASLQILLSTRVGERVMQPKFGCDLHDKVFEPLDAGLRADIKDLVETAILYFEPRILLQDVLLEHDPDGGRLVITVDYLVKTTNSRSNYVHPFYLNEGSEVQP